MASHGINPVAINDFAFQTN